MRAKGEGINIGDTDGCAKRQMLRAEKTVRRSENK